MSTKKKGKKVRGTHIPGENGMYDKVSMDPDADVHFNEYQAMQGAVPGWSLNERGIVNSFVMSPPNTYDKHYNRRKMVIAQATDCSQLLHWRKGEKLTEDRPIVIIDGKCRVAAIGWPQMEFVIIFERMAGDRVLIHEHNESIVSEGMWGMCMTIAMVNTEDAWGSAPGMSATMMFHTVHHASNRFEENQRAARAGAGAA